ncbi:MAG: AbrB/MazE/SpoVT family DNA-binding domain-containing protein [Bacillota bacterium]
MEVGLEVGSKIDLDAEDGHLVIKPRTNTLEDLLSKIMPDNLHSEVQTGEPQGRESWKKNITFLIAATWYSLSLILNRDMSSRGNVQRLRSHLYSITERSV